jgi:hypothetical protein
LRKCSNPQLVHVRKRSLIRYEVLILLEADGLVEGEPRDVIGIQLVGDE